MAEDKYKRRSSRHFDLDKPAKRQFNLEKESDVVEATPARTKPQGGQTISNKSVAGQSTKPKRNFNLNKESEETAQPVVQTNSNGDDGTGSTVTDSNEKKGNSKMWIAAAVIVVALVVGGLLWHNSSKGDAESPEKTYATRDTTAKSPSDSASTNGSAAGGAATSSDDNGGNTGNVAVGNDNSVANSDNAAPSEQTAGATSPSSPSSATPPTGSAHELAVKVWDNAFGTGAERMEKLGSRYREVQTEVNRMYRNGYRPNK